MQRIDTGNRSQQNKQTHEHDVEGFTRLVVKFAIECVPRVIVAVRFKAYFISFNQDVEKFVHVFPTLYSIYGENDYTTEGRPVFTNQPFFEGNIYAFYNIFAKKFLSLSLSGVKKNGSGLFSSTILP
jgi:hypothetical protein